MTISRRKFLRSSMLATAATGIHPFSLSAATNSPVVSKIPGDRFDPWIEVNHKALLHNVAEVRRLTNGRPILAVIKNNAYGLGLTLAAKLLEPLPEIKAFAVVKLDAAIMLRESGIKKPVHLMARFPASAAKELAHQNIIPCIMDADTIDFIKPMANVIGGPVPTQLYLDTGMSRMGINFRKAVPLIKSLANSGRVSFRGVFMGFTEEPDFDVEQLNRFLTVAERSSRAGIKLGTLHAASSSAVFEFPDAHLDMVRPGMALYGGYPNDPEKQSQIGTLKSTINLKTRVVRVQKLKKGDSVSYGRNYFAEKPTWVATIPVGHTDGFPRKAVEGARVLIGKKTYPVIGAVSASHTIIEVGNKKTVNVGDVATLIGSGTPKIDPNWISAKTGASVYNLFMHLNPTLPRVVI
ncbi:MAG: alanine racemase [Candidatus Marinimicrobia bacterium]|nr:alanine racemase [Candidatus Neomarinimicrobiota bacterium]